jgi:hypothetical protein
MPTNLIVRHIDYSVERCPHCGKGHQFKLAIGTARGAPPAIPIFGAVPTVELAFNCPTTGKLFTQNIEPPPGGAVLGLAESSNPSDGTSDTGPDTAMANEYSEWVKASRPNAIDYCKTMLTSSTGAIPIYFVLLKYFGIEKMDKSFAARIAVVPPLMFLAASILFMLAIRPRHSMMTESDFATIRARRLRRLNAYIIVGSILFVVGICATIILIFTFL